MHINQKGGSMPKVSIIMPTYNRGEEICRPLNSLVNQSYSDFEVVIVNDGGESQRERLAQFSSLSIIYDELSQNSGAPTARNRAIDLATGDHITFLDDDDKVLPDHLETLVQAMERGTHSVVYSNAYIQQLLLQSDGSYLEGSRQVFTNTDFNRDHLLIANYIHIANIMFRKECLEKSGRFDPDLTTHQDLDLWIRLSRHYDFLHIPKETSIYYERDEGTSITISNPERRLKNLELLYRRYASYATRDIQYLQGRVLYRMYNSYKLPVPSYLQSYAAEQ